jgi:hypothetical protein
MPPDHADSPLDPSAAHLERIRLRAHQLWEREGSPAGQWLAYWKRAMVLDAIAHYPLAGKPNPLTTPPHETADGVLIEEASLQENLGEFPGLFTDQGDAMPTPESRAIARRFREGER